MADLTTFPQVESELAATAGYDVENDVALAKRRVAALRRKLDFAEASDEEGRKYQFNQAVIQQQLDQVIAWVTQNQDQTDAQKTANPSVTHADFSTFGQYGGNG